MKPLDEKPVPVVVTPEALTKTTRSALRNGKVRVKMAAGQRRAVEAGRARDAAEETGTEPRRAG